MGDLHEAQWEYVRSFVEWDQEVRQRPDGRGGRWGGARRVLNGDISCRIASFKQAKIVIFFKSSDVSMAAGFFLSVWAARA